MSTVTLDNKTILVTGAAGFIGSNLVKRIYQEAPSATVIGIDNMNAYYDVALKEFRLNELAKYPTFTFVKGNIADKELITELFEKYKGRPADLHPILLPVLFLPESGSPLAYFWYIVHAAADADAGPFPSRAGGT